MRFAVVHKTVSFLLVLTSTLALAASGELGPAATLLFLVAMAGSWFWEPPRVDLRRFERGWNVVTVGALLAAGAHVFATGSLLQAGTWFVLFLVVNKLYNRRSSRDYMQAYVLSLLEMIAATALDSDLTYGLFFLLYIIFATWTLILFHLKREMEDNFLLKYEEGLTARPVEVDRVLNSRRLVGGRFLLATSAVSLAVFVGSTLLFFAFPRVGFGLFFQQRRAGVAMTGFGDRVELGHFGTIKDDPTVVMRVEFPDPAQRDRLPPYWRGIAFDTYDGRTWTKSRTDRRRGRSGRDGFIRTGQIRPEDPVVEQHVYLEPMETRMLFGLTRLTGVSFHDQRDVLPMKRRSVHTDADGDLHYDQTDAIAFRYIVRSQPQRIAPEALATPLGAYREAVRGALAARRYLQLPDGLDPRVAALAAEVVGDAQTVGEAVDRVERYLHAEYGYTLELRRDERYAPLEDFLFVQKQGHCEYFSTAMVILLRTQGIAARSVNGFHGGTWNDYGQYLAVSQGDAHSWAEVLLLQPGESARPRSGDGVPLPGGVWMTREPTPTGPGRASAAGFWTSAAQFVDSLRLRWYKYVIEYDLQKQLAFFERIGEAWRKAFGDEPLFGGRSRADARKSGERASPVGYWALGVVLAGFGAFAWYRRRAPAGPRAGAARGHPPPVAVLYRDLIAAYARHGHARAPSATAREFLTALTEAGAPDVDLAARVVALYEAARFGGADVPADQVHKLGRAVRAIGRRPPPR